MEQTQQAIADRQNKIKMQIARQFKSGGEVENLGKLTKGKKMPVGTVSNGRKKQPNGSWTPVKADKKSSKPKTFEEVLNDPEGKKLIENIEGLDHKNPDHHSLYTNSQKQLKQKFGYDYKDSDWDNKPSKETHIVHNDHNGSSVEVVADGKRFKISMNKLPKDLQSKLWGNEGNVKLSKEDLSSINSATKLGRVEDVRLGENGFYQETNHGEHDRVIEDGDAMTIDSLDPDSQEKTIKEGQIIGHKGKNYEVGKEIENGIHSLSERK